MYQGKVEVVLVRLTAEHGKGLAFQQHGLLLGAREELQGTALHVWSKHTRSLVWEPQAGERDGTQDVMLPPPSEEPEPSLTTATISAAHIVTTAVLPGRQLTAIILSLRGYDGCTARV